MTEWLAAARPGADRRPAPGRPGPPPAPVDVPAVGVPRRPGGLPALAHRAEEAARRGGRRDPRRRGYDAATIERTQRIIRKEGLGTDPQVQTHEDALCLVFLETQLARARRRRWATTRCVDVIRKTAAKMSPPAVDLVGDLPMRTAIAP